MIRINLSSFASPKTKRGKRTLVRFRFVPGEGPRPSTLLLVLLFTVVTAGVMYGLNRRAERETSRLRVEMQKAMIENQRLAGLKAKYDASKRYSESVQRQIKVIDDLKAARTAPIELLNLVADTVNKTGAIWLESMTTDGSNVDFTGMALSPNAVADLMANLRKTGKFKSVEIKETVQDNRVKEVHAFKFELICEKGFSEKVQSKT